MFSLTILVYFVRESNREIYRGKGSEFVKKKRNFGVANEKGKISFVTD